MNAMLKKDDGVILDVNSNCLYLGEKEVLLTEKEKRLLHCLARHPGEVTGHTDIGFSVWPERVAAIGPNNILQLIFRLRGKLKLLGIIDGISTVTGEGYRLNVPILLSEKGFSCHRCGLVRRMINSVVRQIISRRKAIALVLMTGAAASLLIHR